MTLLGQNVNAYGVEFGDRRAFAAAPRLRRNRRPGPGALTSPHPKDFTDDVIAAMAETPNVMPQLHMPRKSDQTPSFDRCAARTAASGIWESSTTCSGHA